MARVVLIWRELDVFAVGKLVNLVGACEHIFPFVVHLVKEREQRRERSESRRTARRRRLTSSIPMTAELQVTLHVITGRRMMDGG